MELSLHVSSCWWHPVYFEYYFFIYCWLFSLVHQPPGQGQSGRPSSGVIPDDDRVFWDFCTPSGVEFDISNQHDTVDGIRTFYNKYIYIYLFYSENSGFNPGTRRSYNSSEKANITRSHNSTTYHRQGGSGFNSGEDSEAGGGNGFNPGTNSKRMFSSMVGVECEGECAKDPWTNHYKCDIPGRNPNNFYCSPDNVTQPRQQLSSQSKLWCIGECESSGYGGFYQCRSFLNCNFSSSCCISKY